MLTTGGQPRTFVIPGWVYRAILRNKVNLTDLNNYSKMRSILSQDDMVSWVYLNDCYKLRKSNLTYDLLKTLFDGLTTEEMSEYDMAIQPLATTDAVASSTIERLRDVNNMTSADPYQILNVGDMVLIILNEGFDNAVQSLEDLLNFIRQYLKAQYTVNAIANVSFCPLYTLYIELL